MMFDLAEAGSFPKPGDSTQRCYLFDYKSDVSGRSLTCFNTRQSLVWQVNSDTDLPGINGQHISLNLALDVCKPPEVINSTLQSYTATISTYSDDTLAVSTPNFINGQFAYGALALDAANYGASSGNGMTITLKKAQMCFPTADWNTGTDGAQATCSSVKSQKYTLFDAGANYNGGSKWQFSHGHNAPANKAVTSPFPASSTGIEFFKFIANQMTPNAQVPAQLLQTWTISFNAAQGQSKKQPAGMLRPSSSLKRVGNLRRQLAAGKRTTATPKLTNGKIKIVNEKLRYFGRKSKLTAVRRYSATPSATVSYTDVASQYYVPYQVSVARMDTVNVQNTLTKFSDVYLTVQCPAGSTFNVTSGVGCIIEAEQPPPGPTPSPIYGTVAIACAVVLALGAIGTMMFLGSSGAEGCSCGLFAAAFGGKKGKKKVKKAKKVQN
jgi:hypothetical protein